MMSRCCMVTHVLDGNMVHDLLEENAIVPAGSRLSGASTGDAPHGEPA